MRHLAAGMPVQRNGTKSPTRDKKLRAAVTVLAVATAGLAAAAGSAVAAERRRRAASSKPTSSPARRRSTPSSWTRTEERVGPGEQAPPRRCGCRTTTRGTPRSYSGGINGGAVTLDLTVPVPGANPTGQAYNPDPKAFPVGGPGGSPAVFIIDTDSIGSTQSPGQIEAWNGGAKFVVEAEPDRRGWRARPLRALSSRDLPWPPRRRRDPSCSPRTWPRPGSMSSTGSSPRCARRASSRTQAAAGYAPFGIQELGGKIYVSYGKQNRSKTDVVPGAGLGVVDVYTVNGKLIRHLISNGRKSPLNEPWGLAIAPKGFGPFAGDLLVGNLGNGWINAFNPKGGKFLGALDSTSGYPIVIKGLWGLQVGNSAFGGASSLVFSSGPNSYNSGVVGILRPTR